MHAKPNSAAPPTGAVAEYFNRQDQIYLNALMAGEFQRVRDEVEAFARTFAALIPENAIVQEDAVTSGRPLFPFTFEAAPHDWIQITGGAACGETLDTDYWWRNLRHPVQFHAAMASLAQAGCRVFLEIGPQPIDGGDRDE